MLEEGRLIRRRKGKHKVLWSLAEDRNQERMQSGEKPLSQPVPKNQTPREAG